MSQPLSRRIFLALTGGALAAPSISWAAEDAPPLLDHILLGCSDLDKGIAFVKEKTGVRAAFGGVHPGRGTQNALLSLGEHRYLEIIAPDPKQTSVQQYSVIKDLATPRLIGWAVHPGDIDALGKRLRDSGVAIEGPRSGSRARPDGRVLHWKALGLADDRHGLLPFFIQWSTDSVHPSTDAPAGCRLGDFGLVSPDPDELTKTLQRFGIDAPVERGEKTQLLARLAGPKGLLEVTS
jgi:hypothetical protein